MFVVVVVVVVAAAAVCCCCHAAVAVSSTADVGVGSGRRVTGDGLMGDG